MLRPTKKTFLFQQFFPTNLKPIVEKKKLLKNNYE